MTMPAAPWVKRLAKLPWVMKDGCAAQKNRHSATSAVTAGSEPMSPPRMRSR